MIWIYNIGIALFTVITELASHFNQKAKLFTEGRKKVFEKISAQVDPADRPIWFHFASLGEFEQGRPVLEKIKSINPAQKIIITFFSPSGYEIRKNYIEADAIFYLPMDTAAKAQKFLTLVNPSMAIFTKYEFWFHYFTALRQKQIPLYLISGIFRPGQAFFKWYGGFNRIILKCVSHFFVQNQESASLLKSIGINEVSVSGDTRFDRVYEHAAKPKKLAEIEEFCGEFPVFIAGSTWPADEKILSAFPERYPDWKLIIAPHEVNEQHIQDIEKIFPEAVKFSRIRDRGTKHKDQILLIDNIGMLSSLYQYGKVAYIGGGFGAGIHNTLEAAAFGIPVIFGPKYAKFQEAKDLIAENAAISITNESKLLSAFEHFKTNEKASANAKNYVTSKKGATEMIIAKIS
ncbi:3-deoxy-D-manno-octulosonic acid transferase [Pedobacter insulae]|uniref:3-deoxy-D-manno-octulosonic acid transferase n=1 Tax=Pedobacter insulae TaxID=414048 RepID=A0A1I2TT05_9SPHI|nr:glycosyltransferase N-terminal domain-containing protein [Pedobacter insulae]SFG67339.1 3-deoxy-D-manno-octulosonic-acid transferase [Pedobacter insulae]